MKLYLYVTLIFISIFNSLNAQISTSIGGYEKFNSYEQCIYIDNLCPELIPNIFNSAYYFYCKKTDFKIGIQIIDTLHQKRDVYVYSKKSKDGYLFVNEKIMNEIKELNGKVNEFKVVYMYNNQVVSDDAGVKKILRLRKKKIQNVTILRDEKLGIISAYISVLH